MHPRIAHEKHLAPDPGNGFLRFLTSGSIKAVFRLMCLRATQPRYYPLAGLSHKDGETLASICSGKADTLPRAQLDHLIAHYNGRVVGLSFRSFRSPWLEETRYFKVEGRYVSGPELPEQPVLALREVTKRRLTGHYGRDIGIMNIRVEVESHRITRNQPTEGYITHDMVIKAYGPVISRVITKRATTKMSVFPKEGGLIVAAKIPGSPLTPNQIRYLTASSADTGFTHVTFHDRDGCRVENPRMTGRFAAPEASAAPVPPDPSRRRAATVTVLVA